MKQLLMKARSGVTLVELLVVILIVTILSVSLLPLLKPYIEQAKYAAEVQPTVANIQTKINLYQYEKDQLPGTIIKAGTVTEDTTVSDARAWTWILQTGNTTTSQKVYDKAQMTNLSQKPTQKYTGTDHLADCVDVGWQDLMGRRMNPSQFVYHVIKGKGAAAYGYVLGVFGDGDGLAKGTGYAVLVVVDTANKLKLVGTWERYQPATDDTVTLKVAASGTTPSKEDKYCYIPATADIKGSSTATGTSTGTTVQDYKTMLETLKKAGWSFNFDDAISSK